jgi:translocation and assembly module TamB
LQIPTNIPLQGKLSAQLQELGLATVFLPGKIQESSGQLTLELALAGSLQQPSLLGDVRIADGRCYLPQFGIQLQDIGLQGRFADQLFSLDSQLRSGEGLLTGAGTIDFSSWRTPSYHLEIAGDNVQLFNLPDLQLWISPDLKIEGDLEQVNVTGDILIPQMLASGQAKTSTAVNSPDLVIVDAPGKEHRSYRIQPQLNLQLQLGEGVLIKTSGIDARLEGDLRVESTSQQALAAFGRIHVAQGRYAGYGVALDIDQGNLIFNGGPIDQPLLDILALRTVGDVKAGVQVSGTPKVPQVTLYSDPTLPDTDILSYIVLGRSIDDEGSESSVLLTAAAALLSQGKSVVLQEKIKSKLGIDVLEIDTGDGDTSSSMITTGKYLSPDLYVSFGYSLFDNGNEVKLRYTLSPRWDLESNFGTESGADLYYRIEIP